MRSYKRDGNNRVVFSKDMTLVELIDADYTLLTILQRMGIELPFGDITIEQLCCKYALFDDMPDICVCRL